jgi:membrane protein required for colicin V production
MTWYDLIVVLVIALFALHGLRRGLVGELLGLASFLVGLYLAFRFDGVLGARLARLVTELSPTAARIVAFVVILVLVEVAAGFLTRSLDRVVARIPVVSALNQAGGVLVGVAIALLGVWLVTGALLLLPTTVVPFSGAVHRSATAHLLPNVTPRWPRELRAYVDDFTAGHVDPGLRRELRALSSGQ